MNKIENQKQERKNLFESLIEIVSWIQIAVSPFLIGLLIAVCIYIFKPDNTGFTISIIVASAGLLVGIIWAKRISKKRGATNYISKISASTDFDKIDKE